MLDFGFILGNIGLVMVAIGAYMVYPPAGVIVGGLFLMLESYLLAHAKANTTDKPKDKDV